MSHWAIEAEHLTRYFGRKCAVNSVSMQVPVGSVTALLGRNGSGKTTIIRMLMGMLEPTRGSSRVLGCDSRHLTPEIRARIGYGAENHPLYAWMTIAQLAGHQSRVFRTWNKRLLNTVLDQFALDPHAKIDHLSRGQRAGVALAITLAPEPELLVLDDPSLGLDPVARRAILEVIIDLCGREDRTILISTHELQDVERLADRVLILDQSVLLADSDKDHFLSRIREFVVEPTDPHSAPPPIPACVRVRSEGQQVRITVANADAAVREVLAQWGDIIEERDVSFEDAVIAYLARQDRQRKELMAGGVA